MLRVLLIVGLFVSPRSVVGDDKASPGLGMWSWNQTAFNSASGRKELLAFCKREHISHVDQEVKLKTGSKPVVTNAEALSVLLRQASSNKITISALRGDPSMFLETNHERSLAELRAIIEFNQSQPRTDRLYGVKFDVEPYLTREWKSGKAGIRKLTLDYLNFLTMARQLMKRRKSQLKLTVDVPFWWDKPEHRVAFSGHTKTFVQHIQDLTDEIGIMSYRRQSASVLGLCQQELAYASEIGKANAVSVGLEAVKIDGDDAFISFNGRPVNEFRATIKELRTKLRAHHSSRLIMLHDYQSLASYLK